MPSTTHYKRGDIVLLAFLAKLFTIHSTLVIKNIARFAQKS